MTPGRRSLLAILQRTTAREVAARCKSSPAAVSRWAKGETTPLVSAREALARNYGIPLEAWQVIR